MKKYLRLISVVLLLCQFAVANRVQADEPIVHLFSTNFGAELIVGPVTGAISGCEGTASESPALQQFTLSGSGLFSDVTLLAPSGFEMSFSPYGPFDNIFVLTPTAGLLPQVTIYVRSSIFAPAGNVSDNIQITSSGLAPTVNVTAHINPLPVIDPIASQTKQNGQLTDAIIFTGTAGSYTWTNDNPSIGLPASGSGNIDKFTAINTGTIPVTANITVSPTPASYAYVSNGPLNSVSLVNTITKEIAPVITEGIPANSNPFKMVFSPDKSLLYVCDKGSNTISVINTATNTATTFATVNEPTGIAISPDGSILYVISLSDSRLNIINTTTHVIKTVATAKSPVDLVMSSDGKKLYIIDTGPTSKLVQFYDTATNTFAFSPATTGTPGSVVISPDNKTLYIAITDANEIEVVDIASLALNIIPLDSSPNCLAISPDGARLYVSSANGTNATVINTVTRTVITPVNVGIGQKSVTVSSDGSKVYIVNSAQGYIAVIDAATNIQNGQIPIPIGGNFMSILSDNPCEGQPITFSITVNPSPVVVPPVPGEAVVIPNSFSPNGDGANDTWVIKNISGYPHNTVEIFNRYGQRLFRSNGYGVAWDGEVNGKPLPPGTYYYIVNLKDGSKSLSGSVTIFR